MNRLSNSLGPRSLSMDTLILIIQENLDNKSPKIAWNSCVALANILNNPTLTGEEILFSKQSVKPLLKALEQSANFKTKIHAATTLAKFTSSHTFEKDNLYNDTWLTLVNTLEQHNNAVYSNQDQKKYVQTLDLQIFGLWRDLAESAATKEHSELKIQLKNFINGNCLAFLQTITEFLRKELKVPEYSELYDDKEQLLIETMALFEEQSNLEDKLNMLKSVIQVLRNAIKENEDVHVSFGVFESLNCLADTNVKEYRLLDCLKVQKTSFQASFDDTTRQ